MAVDKHRREYLGVCATVAGLAVAGCTGDEGENGLDETNGGPGDDGSDTGTGDGDGGDDTGTGDNGTDTGDEESENGDSGEDESGSAPFQVAQSYAVEMHAEYETPETGTMEMESSARYNANGNSYHTTTMVVDGQEITSEQYFIDGTQYSVTFGRCSQQDMMFDPDHSGYEAAQEEGDAFGDFTHIGTDTLRGEPVDVYEITQDDVPDQEMNEWKATFYVNSASGHIVRWESEFTDEIDGQLTTGRIVADFHSFGETFDIEKPPEC